MATVKGTVFFLFLLLVISLSQASIHYKKHDGNFQVLDVSASLLQARRVFSSEKPAADAVNLQSLGVSTGNSTFTLTLRSRSSLLRLFHRTLKNYTSLTLSRLARDEARVQSLFSRHSLFVSGFSTSDLEPDELEVPVTSGISQGSGEYFARVGLGSPAKEIYMVIDTGSDISWLQCQPCTDCYQQTGPIYNPSSSSTYRKLTCDSQQCAALQVSACRTDTCLYQVSYGDGSYTVGDFVTETMSFGGGSVSDVALGCGHDNEGLFVAADGLLGLGGGSLSLASQIRATSFSYCLVHRDSSASSTLEFNAAQPSDSILAPLLKNSLISTYHYVGLTGINVGGQPVNIPASTFEIGSDGKGGVIVDSGTAVTRLKTEAYNAMRDAFVAMSSQNLPSPTTGFALFDTCYDLSSKTSVSVPTVSLQFAGGRALRLSPSNYLIPVDDAGKFCFAFAPSSGSLSIIGNVQQQGTRVSYDLANKIVGFSPNKC
ncbi:protein ASPARTIC PROTEASE IN GUARD CELL 1-like [Primulina huaijiensis]|uniref:protein ASPARTIC PROTEASE IN GUARD CELL 1-like n=1 Tax=Primulina huaijiensis TaxID=1492673 RepID=UPI003CC7669C